MKEEKKIRLQMAKMLAVAFSKLTPIQKLEVASFLLNDELLPAKNWYRAAVNKEVEQDTVERWAESCRLNAQWSERMIQNFEWFGKAVFCFAGHGVNVFDTAQPQG